MKLKSKLMSGFVTAALLPLGLVFLFISINLSESVSKDSNVLMHSVAESRADAIETYFENMENQVYDIAHAKSTADAMLEFSAAFGAIASGRETTKYNPAESRSAVARFYEKEFSPRLKENDPTPRSMSDLLPRSDVGLVLQNIFIASNSRPVGNKNGLVDPGGSTTYSRIHAKYHDRFDDWITRYGFYDVFLVEPDNGNVVYSVFKEIDYATSLLSGPHADSGLGQAFKYAIRTGTDEIGLTDMQRYLPSYQAAAGFFSNPIFKDGKLIGVLVAQLPMDRINGVMTDKAHLGDHGITYLAGSDGLLRSQVSNDTQGFEPLSHTVPWDFKEAAGRNRKSDPVLISNDQGEEYLQLLFPLKIANVDWFLSLEMPTDVLWATLNKFTWLLLIMGIVASVFALGVAILMVRNIMNQLGADPAELNLIAAEIADGNLERDIDSKREDSTLGYMAAMQRNLRERGEADKKGMARITRLRDGLNKLSTVVAIADESGKILFANNNCREYFASHEGAIKLLSPEFSAAQIEDACIFQLANSAADVRRGAESTSSAYTHEVVVAGIIARVVISPIVDEDQNRVGYSMEWNDITTDRSVISEVEDVIRAAGKGELHKRIGVEDKVGVYADLSQGINELIEITSSVTSEMKQILGAIASGDLSRTVDADLQGEFGVLKRDANLTVTKLREVVSNIHAGAGNVESSARELNEGNADLSRRTESAAASLEETSSSMEEMTASVAQNADNAHQANQLALAAREKAELGGDVVGEAVSAMAGINESSRKIADIIGVIDDIAFQTNLLALNASVEAARAGEQGRGFAVVASEVRNLAGRSATAAKEIKELIEDSVKRVENGAELVDQSGQTLGDIVSQVKQVTEIVAEITAASQEQSAGIGLVNNAITALDEVTQKNAVLVERGAATSLASSDQAKELLREISFFSVGGDVSADVVSMSAARKKRVVEEKPKPEQPAPVRELPPINKEPAVKVVNSDGDPDWEEF